MYFGATPAFSKCPSIGRLVVLAGRSEAATCTAWYSDSSLRTVLTFAVTWQFSSYNTSCQIQTDKIPKARTCSTVTGYRAPCSSHIAVIPRLRAIKPVRIELGVHVGPFSLSDVLTKALALAATVV